MTSVVQSKLPEAESFFHYDPEMVDVEVIEASLIPSDGTAGLHPLDYSRSVLTAKTTVSLLIKAECGFSFSVRDSIDKDMVDVGGAVVKVQRQVEVDILLAIDNKNPNERKILFVEPVPSTCQVDFGSVSPDYSSDYLEE